MPKSVQQRIVFYVFSQHLNHLQYFVHGLQGIIYMCMLVWCTCKCAHRVLCTLSCANRCTWQVVNWRLVNSLSSDFLQYDLMAELPALRHTHSQTHSSPPLTFLTHPSDQKMLVFFSLSQHSCFLFPLSLLSLHVSFSSCFALRSSRPAPPPSYRHTFLLWCDSKGVQTHVASRREMARKGKYGVRWGGCR